MPLASSFYFGGGEGITAHYHKRIYMSMFFISKILLSTLTVKLFLNIVKNLHNLNIYKAYHIIIIVSCKKF